MKYLKLKNRLAAGSGALVITGSLLSLGTPVMALSSAASSSSSTTNEQSSATRLDAAKLRLCTARADVIGNILKRTADRGNRHLDLISDVATKVQAYYTKKGKTLSNYDTLANAVNSHKTAAQAAVAKVQADSTAFSCSGDDPKGVLTQFKTDVQAQVAALQDYRQAVKDLITGVKTVDGSSSATSQGGNQ